MIWRDFTLSSKSAILCEEGHRSERRSTENCAKENQAITPQSNGIMKVGRVMKPAVSG